MIIGSLGSSGTPDILGSEGTRPYNVVDTVYLYS